MPALRFKKNFSFMSSAEYLCSMKLGEICMGGELPVVGSFAEAIAVDLLLTDRRVVGGLLESLLPWLLLGLLRLLLFEQE